MKTTRARVSLSLPVSPKAAAERYARRDGVSLNQFIATAVVEKVGAQGAAAFFAKRAHGVRAAAPIAFLRSAPDVPPDEQGRLELR